MLIDLYKRDEPIQIELTLCKPDYNRTPITVLLTAYNKEYTARFGSIDEFKFKIPRELDGKIKNEDYDLVKGDFVIQVDIDGRKQYFIIKECNEVVNGQKAYKEITVYSYEYMFFHRLIRDYKEQKSLRELLNYIISLFPSWQVGSSDAELMIKERTLNISEKNVLEVLMDIQKTYLCILEFDTVNREIHVSKLENIGKNRGLVLSESNYAKTINIQPNFSEIITRLKCYGNDNISIHALNPTGSDYIETFEYYMSPFKREGDGQGGYQIIKHSDHMSDELCMALLDYREKIEGKKGEFKEYLEHLKDLNSQMNDLKYNTETGLEKLQTDLEKIQDEIDIKMRAGTRNLAELRQEEENKKAEISTKLIQIENKQAEIDEVYNNIAQLRNEIKLENNLSSQELKELDMFIRERTWQDNNYTEAQELYKEGQNILTRLAQPAITFSVDAVNFLKSLDCSIDWECIISGLGDIINIDIESLEKLFEVRLVSYTYSENGNGLSMTFSNKGSLDDPSIYLKDLLKESISTSTTLNMNRVKYGKYVEEDRNTLLDYINAELDLAKQKAFAGKDQEVIIDKRGILLTDKENPDNQVKLIGDLITFTNNGWNTAGTAVSSQGVVAESIFGKIIAGADLTIENSSGTFTVNNEGVTIKGSSLTITDGLDSSHISDSIMDGVVKLDTDYTNGIRMDTDKGIVVSRSDNKVKTTLNASEGIKIEKYENKGLGLDWQKKFFVDDNGDLTAQDLIANNMTLKDGKIKDRNDNVLIDLANGTINLNNFSIINGNISANNIDASSLRVDSANIDGTITADRVKTNWLEAQTIRGNQIEGGTISGVDIDVKRDVNIGNKLIINANNFANGVTWNYETSEKVAQIYIDSASHALFLYSNSGIYANNRRIDIAAASDNINGGTSSFAGNSATRTIAHGLGTTPKTAVAVANEDTNGYLGEVWVDFDSTYIYVGNTGSFTGGMNWIAVA